MILGWIQRDGMARMNMIGVVPTPFIVSCISHFIGFVTVLHCENDILSQLPLEVFNNKQPLDRLLE